MQPTKIDWPWKPLWTWNPVSGCLHPCRKTYCYNTTKSTSVLNRYGIRYKEGNKFKRTKDWKSRETGKIHIAESGEIYPYGFDPTYYPHRLGEPSKMKKPCNIFPVDVGDLFGDWVPERWINAVIGATEAYSRHTFMFLTKNPKRYAEFEFPENCWKGVTITKSQDINLETFSEAFRPKDQNFISIEPILGEFQIRNFNFLFDLFIIGAMTGPNAVVPKREWIDSIKHPNIYYKDNLRKIFPDLKND